MKIWIDLANSPQVLFFKPILKELEKRKHTVKLTTRDYAQTIQLADQFGLEHTTFGGHAGKNRVGLFAQILSRALSLKHWAKSHSFDLAVSHNSYSQILAAFLSRLPSVTFMDYEHQPLNHLGFRLASRVVVPEPFPIEKIRHFGAGNKYQTYQGIKEQVYLAEFSPQSDFIHQEGFPSNLPLVVIRPPAPWTAYHTFENDLFDQLLQVLNANISIYCLFVPRLKSQAESVRHLGNINVATKVFDGPNLLYHASMVISGGGTMNREAAVLGTPTFTIFKGQLGAVDRYLIERGRMYHLTSADQFSQLDPGALNKLPVFVNKEQITEIVDKILSDT